MWNNKCFSHLDYFNLNKEINIYTLSLFDATSYLSFFKYFYFKILNDVVDKSFDHLKTGGYSLTICPIIFYFTYFVSFEHLHSQDQNPCILQTNKIGLAYKSKQKAWLR